MGIVFWGSHCAHCGTSAVCLALISWGRLICMARQLLVAMQESQGVEAIWCKQSLEAVKSVRPLACRLGLRRASARVKRAIQFGSRLSRQANVRDFGSNRAANMARAGGLQLSDAPRCPRP